MLHADGGSVCRLHRMSAPFKFHGHGTPPSSGNISSSRDTTPTKRTARGKSIMRSTVARSGKGQSAARTAHRTPGQTYVHFQPSMSPVRAGPLADASSEGSQEDPPLSGDSAAAPYDHQQPQPRSPLASGLSGPSGASAVGAAGPPRETGRGEGLQDAATAAWAAAAPTAGAGGPFSGTAAEARAAAPGPARVSRKQVEGGVVAEARVQRSREGTPYGAAPTSPSLLLLPVIQPQPGAASAHVRCTTTPSCAFRIVTWTCTGPVHSCGPRGDASCMCRFKLCNAEVAERRERPARGHAPGSALAVRC